jgi:hypothetical protein
MGASPLSPTFLEKPSAPPVGRPAPKDMLNHAHVEPLCYSSDATPQSNLESQFHFNGLAGMLAGDAVHIAPVSS